MISQNENIKKLEQGLLLILGLTMLGLTMLNPYKKRHCRGIIPLCPIYFIIKSVNRIKKRLIS